MIALGSVSCHTHHCTLTLNINTRTIMDITTSLCKHVQSFGDWDEDYDAYTYQAEQIIEVLDLYIGMTSRGQIEQAPSHPLQ